MIFRVLGDLEFCHSLLLHFLLDDPEFRFEPSSSTQTDQPPPPQQHLPCEVSLCVSVSSFVVVFMVFYSFLLLVFMCCSFFDFRSEKKEFNHNPGGPPSPPNDTGKSTPRGGVCGVVCVCVPVCGAGPRRGWRGRGDERGVGTSTSRDKKCFFNQHCFVEKCFYHKKRNDFVIVFFNKLCCPCVRRKRPSVCETPFWSSTALGTPSALSHQTK